jgi:membrane fusion protein (multidrug efflux system)
MKTTVPRYSLRKLSVLAAAVSLGAVLAACGKSEPPPPPPPSVNVLTVAPRDVAVYTEWVGTIDGDVNATIRPQVTGYLIKQNYREGDFVKKGQTLFEIDPRTFVAAVDQATAARNQQAAIHANAAATLARVRPLAEKNALSRKDLDDAVGNEMSSRAALDQATAALETAKLNLNFTHIVSPIDGVAGIAKAQIGDLLSPTATEELTTVSTVDPVRVYVNVSEREFMNYRASHSSNAARDVPLELILVDGSVYPYPGRFTLINRQVDVTTGTFKVGAIFPNPGNKLRPGQYAKIRATVSSVKGALLVPQRAVTEMQGKYLVAVVDASNKVDVRSVKMGERIGSDWIVSEGLAAGDKVVVEGTQKARPGATVNPQPYAPPAASPAAAKPADKPASANTAEKPATKG